MFQWLRWPVAVGPVATAAVLLGIVVLTRIRQQPGADSPWRNHDDPVGKCSLRVQEPMWASPGINVTLRWLHLAAGLSAIALLAAWPHAGARRDGPGRPRTGHGRPGCRRRAARLV